MSTSQNAQHTGSHSHVFLGESHDRNERRTWAVIAITVVMMVVEIAAGSAYGSMALVADGWHMSTHASAMLISALAYRYARKHASNPRFTFGTGKLGDLAGFASAIVLALIALLIGWESFQRFVAPVAIDFSQAIVVAVVGLVVNLACAWLLSGRHNRGQHDGHEHHHSGDNNFRAAYMHVLADALTSVLAIGALVVGGALGWLWLDPVIGVVGALVIARWSWGLIRDAGGVLLDYAASDEPLPGEIRTVIESPGNTITDLHVWQLGPGHHGAIVSITSAAPQAPSYYRKKLEHIHELSHVTVEVEPAL